jgi:pimeloyl-ACP methyl ester carboxylesterase
MPFHSPQENPNLSRMSVIVAVAIVALLLGCGGPATSSAPSPEPQPATNTPSVIPSPTSEATVRLLDGQPMRACRLHGGAALCGTLTVAENPDDPTARQIDLNVAVIPARGPDPEPDPLFMLAGGPGGAAIDSFGWSFSTFSRLNATRDFVLVDQRGTGGSNRLVAPPSPDVTGMDEATRDATIRSWVADVRAELPGDPRFYTTSLAMDDIDAVREALGYERINLYGPSYGATAAQYYLRQHEEHVRAVVLDGGTLLDVPIFERIAANSQRALDLLFRRCVADPACQPAFPDLEAEFEAVVARLAEAPVSTPIIHPGSGEPIVFDSTTFAAGVHSALVDASFSSRLPALIHLAFLERWDAVAEAIAQANVGQAAGDDQLVMSAVIRCSEAWARYDPAEVQRLGAGSYSLDLQLEGARAQAESCRYVPDGVVPGDDAEPVRSDVPVLLVVGDADPQDPPPNVEDAPVELPNSLTVVVPGMGHTVGHLGCMPSIIVNFFEAGTVDGLDVSCAATGVPIPPFWFPN